MPKAHPEPRHTTTPRQRVWVFAFLGGALILFGSVLVLASGTSRIAFTWTPQPVHTATAMTLASSPAGDDLMTKVVETTVDIAKTFTAVTKTADTPAETPAFHGKARGRVTITNRYAKAQPLQAGTRLQSTDGQIFRTQARIDVPAGGSVTTLVVADVAGVQGALKQGATFILPALWAGLQAQITGTAAENFYGDSTAPAATPGLTANELANAEDSLQAEAVDQAMEKLNALVPEGYTLYPGLTFAETTKRVGPSIGEAKQTYALQLTVRVRGFSVDMKVLGEKGKAFLATTIAQDVQLLPLDPATFTYSIERYDAKTQRATGSMDVQGLTVPLPSHHLLQHATYAGKSPADVRALLQAEAAISNVQVELSPFWTRRVPTAAQNLKIEVTRSE